MIISVKYPKGCSIRVFNNTVNANLINTAYTDDGYCNDCYTLEDADYILVDIEYNAATKKYTLFKRNWFNYLFSSFLSFDYFVDYRRFKFSFKSRETSKLEIVFGIEQMESTMNGCIRYVDVKKTDYKKLTFTGLKKYPLSESALRKLKAAIMLAMIVNLLIYFIIPVFYSIIIFCFPFLLRGESFIDYILVILLLVLFVVNLFRYIISYKNLLLVIRSKLMA